MADIACPLPDLPQRAALLKLVGQVKREMPGVKIGALRREAARRAGLDYKTFMDIWDKRTPAVSITNLDNIKKITKTVKTVGVQRSSSDLIKDAVSGANADGIKSISRSKVTFSDPAYSVNCQKTAYATELRMRGLNVVAEPGAGDSYDLDGMYRLWSNPRGKDAMSSGTIGAFVTDYKSKAALMKRFAERAASAPANARYIIDVQWKDGGGHVLNAIKLDDGSIRFFDGQHAMEDANDLIWKNAKYVSGFRVDDLEPGIGRKFVRSITS